MKLCGLVTSLRLLTPVVDGGTIESLQQTLESQPTHLPFMLGLLVDYFMMKQKFGVCLEMFAWFFSKAVRLRNLFSFCLSASKEEYDYRGTRRAVS